MADYVNPLGPPSIDSEDTQNDAIEEANSTNRQRNQLGQGTKSDGVKQTAHDDQTEAKDEDEANEEGEGKAESERKEGEVIRTGQFSPLTLLLMVPSKQVDSPFKTIHSCGFEWCDNCA